MADRLFHTLVNAAKQALQSRDFEEAGRVIAKLRESYPSQAASGGLSLELLLAQGDLSEATGLAARLAERFPGSAGILFQSGMVRFRLKEYQRALQLFEESERLFYSRKTRRWRGKTLTNLGRFNDAEPLLINLMAEDPSCAVDLAWLYERKGDTTRAMAFITKHLERFPNDRLAQAQKTRLNASTLNGPELIEQMDLLSELGEPVPEALTANYFSALVAAGRSDDARRYAEEWRGQHNAKTLLNLAWTCYRLQMHDLAYELFMPMLEHRLSDVKLQTSLELSAKCAGRVDDLLQVYETLGPKQPKLYGRAKRLKGSR